VSIYVTVAFKENTVGGFDMSSPSEEEPGILDQMIDIDGSSDPSDMHQSYHRHHPNSPGEDDVLEPDPSDSSD
jgi:hypothetical protein